MTDTPPPHDSDSPPSATEMVMEELRMNFGDHLEELRKRILLALAGTGLVFLATLYYGSPIVVWLLRPLIDAQRQAGIPPMTVAGITSGFTTYILVAAASALIIASPWVFYQLWQFIAAGLYPSERKMIVILAPMSGLMATLGICFLYYVLLPVGLFFFLSFTASYPAIPAGQDGTLSEATAWVNKMAVKYSGMSWGKEKPKLQVAPPATQPAGTLADQPTSQPSVQTTTQPATQPTSQPAAQPAVQIPILTADPAYPVEGQIWLKQPEGEIRVVLNQEVRTLTLGINSLITPLVHVGDYLKFVAFLALGVVLAFQTPVFMLILAWTGLVQASAFRKYRRHAVLVCFILSAILTPPDPVTMTMLAVPMFLLFEFGLILMTIAHRNKDNLAHLDDAEEST